MSPNSASEKSCFVMTPHRERFTTVIETAIRPAVESTNLRCVVSQDSVGPGKIPDQIADDIGRATMCIADLTGNNRNVIYEVAIAHERKKPVILITSGSLDDIPYDLHQFRTFTYDDNDSGLAKLRRTLVRSIGEALETPGPPTELLRQMLVPASLGTDPQPFVIASNPLSWREAAKRGGGFKMLRSTGADHVGIRGLIQAFGSIYGLNRLPDLLNPDDYEDEVATESPMHLYSIGSPKANRWTGLLMDAFSEKWEPRLEFAADPDGRDLRNVHVMVRQDGLPYTPPAGDRSAPRPPAAPPRTRSTSRRSTISCSITPTAASTITRTRSGPWSPWNATKPRVDHTRRSRNPSTWSRCSRSERSDQRGDAEPRCTRPPTSHAQRPAVVRAVLNEVVGPHMVLPLWPQPDAFHSRL